MESVKRYSPYKEAKMLAEASESNRLEAQAKLDRVTAERNALQLLLNDLEEQNHSLEQRRHAEQQACQAAVLALIAENEALRQSITDINSALEREYWSEYAGLDETRAILDAAMSKEPQP